MNGVGVGVMGHGKEELTRNREEKRNRVLLCKCVHLNGTKRKSEERVEMNKIDGAQGSWSWSCGRNERARGSGTVMDRRGRHTANK